MPLASINLITLIISLALEIWLGIVLFRRSVQKDYPLFFAFIVVTIPISAARLLTTSHYHAYYYVYWSSEALLILLSVSALNQVFWKTYEGFRFLWWFRSIYYGAILLALAISIHNAIRNPPAGQNSEIAFILDAEIAANMVRAGIVGVFAVMVRPMVVEFRRYPFGIVAGFGASSLGPVLAFFSLSISGTNENFTRIFSALSYIVALVIWLRMFSLPDTEEKEWKPPIPPEEMAKTVRGYIDALGFSGKKKK